jgi:hypothetical protein
MINFTYDITIPPGTLESDPYREEVKLTTGRLKRVSIGFPQGCRGTVYVNVLLNTLQIVPIIEGQSYHWDNISQNFDVNFVLDDTSPMIVLRGWSPEARYEHTISFIFSVATEEEENKVANLLAGIIQG